MRKPALFPQHTNQQNISSGGDRMIPIVKEADGSIVVSNRFDHDTSSAHPVPISYTQHESNVEKMPEGNIRLSSGASEVEGNDQSAASSSASCTTSSSGLGTSVTGDHSCITSDAAITQYRYARILSNCNNHYIYFVLEEIFLTYFNPCVIYFLPA